MKKIFKKTAALALVSASLLGGAAGLASAQTVYYKGKAVNWDHGRTWDVYSYSDVGTQHFTHSATANSTFSGWQPPGLRAYASQYVGFSGTATAYWSCK